MKKRIVMSLIVSILTMTSSISAFAAPKQMADGNMFDTEYYATNNPDVVAVLGTDETMLYSHYINCGKTEGRKPYADGAVTPKFDAVYYAKNNPDVVAVLGTDETILYNHYITCGRNEGRIPCEGGTPFIEVALPEPQIIKFFDAIPNPHDYPENTWIDAGSYFFAYGYYPFGWITDEQWEAQIDSMEQTLETRYPGIRAIGGGGFHLNDGTKRWVFLAQKSNDTACTAFYNKYVCSGKNCGNHSPR